MLKHRFLLCFVALVVLSVSYVAYRTYQEHVDFEEFLSKAKTFQFSLDKNTSPTIGSANRQTVQMASPGIDNSRNSTDTSTVPIKVNLIDSRNRVVKTEWVDPADIPEESIGTTWTADQMIQQSIELPNSTVIEILSIPGTEIREGDAVSLEELGSRMRTRVTIMRDGIPYEVPVDEAPEIAKRKSLWSRSLGVSMEDINQMIANRELVVPPITQEEHEINIKLLRKFGKRVTTESESFGDENWRDAELMPVSDATDSVSARDNSFEDIDIPSARAKVSPAAGELKTPVLRQQGDGEPYAPHIEKNVEAAPREKVQQLIDQYGTAEGLRRMREMDPEAARQFEQGRRPSRDAPDKGQSESGSKD